MAPLTFDCTDQCQNASGLNVRSLVDMQKFLACSLLLKQASFDNEQKAGLKTIVVSNNYSARTGLVFKANESLRRQRANSKHVKGQTTNGCRVPTCLELVLKGPIFVDDMEQVWARSYFV